MKLTEHEKIILSNLLRNELDSVEEDILDTHDSDLESYFNELDVILQKIKKI